MEDVTVIVPYWNGRTLDALLDSLPEGLLVIVVDDHSDEPLALDRPGVRVIRPAEKGFFAGAVNAGVDACQTDVLILNQDARLEGDAWRDLLAGKRGECAVIGDGVMNHPAWPNGYVQGTFMFIRRDAWQAVGPFNQRDYPLWGATCEWQLRTCRQGFRTLPLPEVPGLIHGDDDREKVVLRNRQGDRRTLKLGSAIAEAVRREPSRISEFLRTPPAVSVIVPCYNYAHLLPDAINSLVGGDTSLGQMPPQTLQSFEVVIVDDASPDDTPEMSRALADPWRGVRYLRLEHNRGTAGAINAGIAQAHGQYIHVLSADDMREPWCLETLWRACRANPRGVAYGNLRLFKHGQRLKRAKLPAYDFDQLLHKNCMSAGIMYPRRAWAETGGYPEQMRDGREDWAFNVALGVAGYCGVKVDWGERGPGLLYRREGQNRTLTNTTPVHKRRFLDKLRALFPRIYEGYRPMGCCGGRNNNRAVAGRKSASAATQDLTGKAGMDMLEYVGASSGTMTWYGPVTGQRYLAGDSRRIIYVDERDAVGMLDLLDNRRPVFRRYQPSAPAPSVKEQVTAALEGDSTEAPSTVDEPLSRRADGELDAGELIEPASAVLTEKEVSATSAARKLAREHGIDLNAVEGSGRGGRIIKRDVDAFLAAIA